MQRCPFPRQMVRIAKIWDACEAYEESISRRFKASKLGKFIGKYKHVLRNFVFIILLYGKVEAGKERDIYKMANERLVMHGAVVSSKYESKAMTRWKKMMLGSLEHPTFVMVEVGPSYEKKFLEVYGLSLGDYLGRTDYDVWPKEIADEFFAEDLHVSKTGETVYTKGTNPNGGHLLIIKERLIQNSRTYVLGAAIDLEQAKNWFRDCGRWPTVKEASKINYPQN